MIKVSAPCKVHLLGEHSAVYCKPAILTAVGKRMYVTLTPRPDNQIIIKSNNINQELKTSKEVILAKTKKAQKLWDKFITTNDIPLLKSITVNPLDYIEIAIGESLIFYKETLPTGFDLKIESEIPIGAGLGSSAVAAVTIPAAITLFLKKAFDKTIINQIAYLVERKKHGNPSGGDTSASCFGGLIWFRKETNEFKVIQALPFSLSNKLAKNFILIDTGTPDELSGEMIALVKNLQKDSPAVLEKFLDNQETLVRDLLKVIQEANEAELIKIIRAGEKNLESIGVCSPKVKKLIRQIEKVGGAAKICGAGGKTKATGIVLAYHKDKKVLEKIAKENGLNYFTAALGVEGLRQES